MYIPPPVNEQLGKWLQADPALPRHVSAPNIKTEMFDVPLPFCSEPQPLLDSIERELYICIARVKGQPLQLWKNLIVQE